MNDFNIDYLGSHLEFSKEVAELWTKEWSADYSKRKVAEKAKKNETLYSSKEPPFILVAYRGSELLGTSALLVEELKNRPEYNIWLGGVFVKPEFRGSGVAKRLIEEALTSAKELGYKKIFLKTEHAQGFYEKLGWKHLEKTYNNDGTPTDVYSKNL